MKRKRDIPGIVLLVAFAIYLASLLLGVFERQWHGVIDRETKTIITRKPMK